MDRFLEQVQVCVHVAASQEQRIVNLDRLTKHKREAETPQESSFSQYDVAARDR